MKSMTHSHLCSLKMNSHTFQNVIHFTLGCPQASTDQKPLCLHVGIYEWKHSVIGEFSESNSQTVRIKPYSPTPGQALFCIYVHIPYSSPLFIHWLFEVFIHSVSNLPTTPTPTHKSLQVLAILASTRGNPFSSQKAHHWILRGTSLP